MTKKSRGGKVKGKKKKKKVIINAASRTNWLRKTATAR